VKRSPRKKDNFFCWVTFGQHVYKIDFRKVDYYLEELVVQEIKKRNEVVLRGLYKKHFPMVLHLVCSNSGTEQEAKDVFQEAMIAFYEKVQQPDFVLTCQIKTFLYAISQRVWLKRLSTKKRFVGDASLPHEESFLGMEEVLEEMKSKEDSYNAMAIALERLGEPCRSIVEDFYFRNFSMEDIREKFGYTNADNAKNQKYKCLQRLKKLFFEGYLKNEE
jgi:RNA polymerase sigma factor (sigma-70 family)